QAAFQERARIHSRRGVTLVIDDVPVACLRTRPKKVVECDIVKVRGRGISRNVSADAVLLFVGADHHGHGVPAHQALDPPLHFLAAWKWRLLPDRNRILVGSGGSKRKVDSGGPSSMKLKL